MQPRILVVDDDAATRKMINTALGQSGFDILEAGTAAEAVEAIRREDPDVVLLDLILPDGDGVQVCREVRQYSDVSIIMVTAKRDLTDRLAGLDAGADDYVTKPLSMGELVARVKSLLRRRRMREQEEPSEIGRGDLSLNPSQRTATVAGREVMLSEVEASVLAALIGARGEALSSDQIADMIWSEGEGDPMVLQTHIANLRHKLEHDPHDPKYILSADGGYRIA
ncbi:MAG: response regulator transcription factor [candidate division WS1 bacterium]|jgi:DNA-binding response OmpR family regulator|nr:response regulator transcription factor [candidate division WS1 bacterium]